MYSLRALRGLLILLGMMLVAGCGGGDGDTSTPPAATTGRAVFSIVWPDRTRVIPLASNSIRLALYSGQTLIASQLVARPVAGGTVSVPFEALPPGDLTLSAQSFPNADGTGVTQGTASVPIAVTAGQTKTLNIDLNSTVDHLQVASNSSDIISTTIDAQGRTEYLSSSYLSPPILPLSFTARNANGDVVLTSAPQNVQWGSKDSLLITFEAQGNTIYTASAEPIISIDASGQAHFLKEGKVTVTVYDPETGKSGEAVFIITVFINSPVP